MDFDPRWDDDPRDLDDRDRLRAEALAEVRELSQGSRGVSSDPLERDARNPHDVFTRDLDLPRGPDRERVWFREHSVLLRGSESRALATTGAFRVVHADDLRDSRGNAFDPRSGELRHLREQKLVRTIPIRDGRALVVLTERGRDVLERNRHEREQHFYSGLQRPRELLHDAKVYQAYEREAERLREDGAVIHRVMLDTELKREYQQFLQEHNRGKSDSDGRPDRSPDEIARWAMDHDLPEKDGHVQFPDARIVYEDRDGREQTRDIEVETLNYRGAHASANGVLLRADLHRLFDQGYLTITPEYRLEVSPRLKEDYQNGRSYYPLHGSSVVVPATAADAPSVDFLRWHNDRVYRAV